ncbi:hypothetical protein FB385_0414 [Paramicrobacterium agarici]|nr:hypothetical protein FB385_0414 [Microbacterium agarici]
MRNMSTAYEPVRRHDATAQGTGLHDQQARLSELDAFRQWVPIPTPTEGQPYRAMKELKEHPPSETNHPHVVHPRGIDAHGSLF